MRLVYVCTRRRLAILPAAAIRTVVSPTWHTVARGNKWSQAYYVSLIVGTSMVLLLAFGAYQAKPRFDWDYFSKTSHFINLCTNHKLQELNLLTPYCIKKDSRFGHCELWPVLTKIIEHRHCRRLLHLARDRVIDELNDTSTSKPTTGRYLIRICICSAISDKLHFSCI